MLWSERGKRPVYSQMPSLHDDKPISLFQILRFSPDDFSAPIDDGQRVIVCDPNPQAEFGFY